YEVEKIFDHKFDKEGEVVKYRVKWQGYDESEDTWETAETLNEYCSLLLPSPSAQVTHRLRHRNCSVLLDEYKTSQEAPAPAAESSKQPATPTSSQEDIKPAAKTLKRQAPASSSQEDEPAAKSSKQQEETNDKN
ncbi:MAG: hypothetical protein Q9174_006776, partial [Haloplaca sp. 1 TL-2023]